MQRPRPLSSVDYTLDRSVLCHRLRDRNGRPLAPGLYKQTGAHYAGTRRTRQDQELDIRCTITTLLIITTARGTNGPSRPRRGHAANVYNSSTCVHLLFIKRLFCVNCESSDRQHLNQKRVRRSQVTERSPRVMRAIEKQTTDGVTTVTTPKRIVFLQRLVLTCLIPPTGRRSAHEYNCLLIKERHLKNKQQQQQTDVYNIYM